MLVEVNERETALEILGEYGFQIDKAENGAESVKKIAASRPGDYEVIMTLCSWTSRLVMDGCEATQAIRALENPVLDSIPILAMTATIFEEGRKAAAECGMNGFLSKPIQIEELVQTLQSVFESGTISAWLPKSQTSARRRLIRIPLLTSLLIEKELDGYERYNNGCLHESSKFTR